MVGCDWCGTTEVKLAENKPYCPKGSAQFVTSHILIRSSTKNIARGVILANHVT